MTVPKLTPIHKCATCGQRVTVYSSGEETNSYEPWCEERIAELESALEDIIAHSNPPFVEQSWFKYIGEVAKDALKKTGKEC